MPEEQKNEDDQNKWKIDWRSLLLGIILNILTIIVFILLYHAYIVAPKMEGGMTITPSPIEQPDLNQLP